VRHDPDLWRRFIEVTEAEEGYTHQNGLEIVFDVNMRGLQKNSVVTLFAVEPDTGEEILLCQGRIIVIAKQQGKENSTIQILAAGPGLFMQEITSQMMSLRKSLQVKNDWESQLGVSAVSDIVTTLQNDGLADGSMKLLDKAGNNTNLPANLIWRMHRLFHRISALDNPKALGSFNAGRMSEILDDALGEMRADAPLSAILTKAFDLVNYSKICNLAPSFMNALYSSESGAPGTLNECDISVDRESTHVDYNESIASGQYHLKTNEVVYMPNLFLAPPPRCNVIFPTQYEGLQESQDFTKEPTRGIVNVTGEGTISVGSDNDALIMPETVRAGISSDGKYYVDPAERINGVVWSTFASSRPQAAEELGSDYIRGLMETIFAHDKYKGHVTQLSGTTFNPKPVVGLPLLILCNDGDHLISELIGLEHKFDSNSIWTQYEIGMTRLYDEPIPSEPATYWYEHDMYSQDNIGAYIYPRIVGQYYEGDLEVLTSGADVADRSILVHLYNKPVEIQEVITAAEARERGMVVPDEFPDDYEMTVITVSSDSAETTEALFEAEDAVQKAVDNLWDWYKQAPTNTYFETFYGRRAPISAKHWFVDFFKCKGTDDKFLYYGGYTLATNSVTLEDDGGQVTTEEDQTDSDGSSYGEKLPRDAQIAGLFVTEKQHIYIDPAIRCASMDRVPIEISDPPTRDELAQVGMENLLESLMGDNG
jgi:hypothetical protein